MSATQSTVEYRDLESLGFPGYRVGSDGSVWSCWHKRSLGRPLGFAYERGPWWQMKTVPLKTKVPYLTVTLTGHKRVMVHRLVLLAFVGPCPPGKVARHFPDRDPANCRRENLSWGSNAENQADRLTHGTDHCGERSPCAKLTDEQARALRAEYTAALENGRLAYGTLPRLTKKYGIGRTQAKRIARGERKGSPAATGR